MTKEKLLTEKEIEKALTESNAFKELSTIGKKGFMDYFCDYYNLFLAIAKAQAEKAYVLMQQSVIDAINDYAEGKLSKGKLAELLGVNYHDLLSAFCKASKEFELQPKWQDKPDKEGAWICQRGRGTPSLHVVVLDEQNRLLITNVLSKPITVESICRVWENTKFLHIPEPEVKDES